MTAPDALTTTVDPRLSRFEAESPGAARLAELASLAVRVDTGLLRRLRQMLLPDTDVGAESDLWFSAIVEARSETGFQIAPEIAAQLRDRLNSMPDRPPVAAVRAILREAHATVSPAIRLEEEINGIALELGDGGREAIDTALRSALATMARSGTEATDVARWALLAIPRLHPIVRDTTNARTLMAAASLLLRRRVRFSEGVPEPDVRISSLRWAVLGNPRSQRIGVAFVPGGLQFRGSVDAAEGFIDVPITDPVMVEIEWESSSGPRHRLTQPGDGVLVPLDGEPQAVTITTLLGDQFNVTSVVDVMRVAEQAQVARADDAAAVPAPGHVRVFYIYAHEDERYRVELETFLAPLRRRDLIETWYDRRIPAGVEWDSTIAEQLERADIFVFLLSANLLASDYIDGVEARRAFERANSGAAVVIPIILRPVDWSSSWLSQFQALPQNAKPITTFRPRDAGWAEVARGIQQVAERVRQDFGAEATLRRAVRPPDALLDACVQIEPLGRAEPIGVAFAVEPTLLIGVRDNIEPLPIVGVHGDARQLQVIRPSAGGDILVPGFDTALVGLRPVGSASTVYSTTLAPNVPGEVEALRAAAAGFVDEEAKWFDVALEPRVMGSSPRGVIFDAPDLSQEELEAAFVGSPLVVNQRAVGVVVGVTRPQGHDTYATIAFADAAHLKQGIDRARRAVPPDNPLGTRSRVFISYAPEDREAAMRIRETLVNAGFDVWLDITIRSGVSWQEELERALEQSDFFLAILSTQSISRGESAMRAEWELARSRQARRGGDFLLPVAIDDLSPSDERVPGFLKNSRWASAPGGRLPDDVIASLRQSSGEATRPTVDESPRPSERYSIDIAEILLPAIVREAIAELLRSQRTSILVINGPRQSPINEVVRVVQQKGDTDFERTIVELAESRSGYSGRELAKEIAVNAGLNVDEIPRFEGSSDLRAARDVAVWLVSALESTGAPRILTIHGFERIVAQQDVLEVVSQVITRITESKGRLRLLLLNYTAPLPVATESHVRRVTLEPVNRRDVQRFMTRLFEGMGRPFEPAAVEQATESVFAPFASLGSWEYDDLRYRLAQAAQALTEA